jgi:hypothetical protein
VDEGYARLPGAGYETLHPEMAGWDREDYSDINKMAILADVAPYSREYNIEAHEKDFHSREVREKHTSGAKAQCSPAPFRHD